MMIHIHADTIDHALWFVREQDLLPDTYRIMTDNHIQSGWSYRKATKVIVFNNISDEHLGEVDRNRRLYGFEIDWVAGRL